MPNRELPQITPEGPFGRPNGHGLPPHPPVHSPQDPNPHGFHQPMNGAHDASPDYRARMGYPPPDQMSNGEHTPVSGALPPASQFMTPAPQLVAGSTPPGAYDPGYYQSQAMGSRQRKANRATQVS